MKFPWQPEPVTRDDVLWCYRNLLRREPESEAAIAPHLTHTSFRDLAESFANSYEAKQPLTRDDVLWCYRNILGREPEETELSDASMTMRLAHKNFRELANSFADREDGLQAVTRNDVLWAYRHVLRREPESEAVVELNRGVASFRQLIEVMGNSEEVLRPLKRDDVLWCYRHILGRDPKPHEPLEPHPMHGDFRSLAMSFGERAAELPVLTRDDVNWAYRNILGRVPESDDAVEPHLKHKSFREMAEALAASPEATRLREAGIAEVNRRNQILLSIHTSLRSTGNGTKAAAPNTIDSVATIAELTLCVQHLQKGRASRASLAPDASGLMDKSRISLTSSAEQAYSLFVRHGAPPDLPGMLVHLGCEMDQITLPLAKRVGIVRGYEFSADHLAIAKSRASAEGIRNVTFHQCDEQMLKSFPVCNYFLSMSALSVCPPPLISALVRNALRALLPGGIAVFQLLTEMENYGFKLAAWIAEESAGPVRQHALPALRMREIINGQGCELLSVEENEADAHMCQTLSTFVVRKPY
jgi:SAM-dependent methyltransferase